MKNFCVLFILLLFFSCRSVRRLSDQKEESGIASTSVFAVKDSLGVLFDKSEFETKEWNVVWEKTLYGDTGSSAFAKEKQTMRIVARSVAEQETTSDRKIVKNSFQNSRDSIRIKKASAENVEKESLPIVPILTRIFFILLLIVGIVYIWKSKN